MKRAIVAGAAAMIMATGASAAEAAPRHGCPAPRGLTLAHKPGHRAAMLSWRRSSRAPRGTRYRIYRDRTVIGETRRGWIKVRVAPGQRYSFSVRLVTKQGRQLRCGAKLRTAVTYAGPATPQNLAVAGSTGGSAVQLTWSPSQAGDYRIAAYRVLRNRTTFKQISGTVLTVRLANSRSDQYTVAAVDQHGGVSAPSAPVTIETGHVPPPAPTNLLASSVTDSSLTLSWAPSQPARGQVTGYRVYRDGKLLFTVHGLSTPVTGLGAATAHAFTVAAVDSSGWLSAPSAPATVSTTPPVQSTGRAQAFLLATTDQSFKDLQAHYMQIGVVYPTYFDCNAAGAITGQDDPLVTHWSQQHGIKVMPRFNCQNTATLDNILNQPALRAQWLDSMTSMVQSNGYDGLSLDFEAGSAADRSAYTSFVTELASRLHGAGKLLTVAVSSKTADVPNHPRSTFFDYNALSQQADWIFVMGWGIHWTTSTPGAQDDLQWLSQVLAYVDTIPQKGRFVLGMQLYAMDWPNGGGASHPSTSYEYADVRALMQRVGATPALDAASDNWHFTYQDGAGATHDVWFPDAQTTGDRIQLARNHGLGVGFWRLGNEDQRLWSNPLLP